MRFFARIAILSCAALPPAAMAQSWPAKPIRMLIPYPAGGTSDILTRMIGPKLTAAWGPQVLITISSEKRDPTLPNIPTVETPGLEGFVTGSYQGIMSPAKVPPAVIGKFNAEVNRIISTAEIREKLAAYGTVPLPMAPQDLGKRRGAEKERWSKVVTTSGFKIE